MPLFANEDVNTLPVQKAIFLFAIASRCGGGGTITIERQKIAIGGSIISMVPARAARSGFCCPNSMRTSPLKPVRDVERVMGIEPTYQAWEARVLPLNYTREEQAGILQEVARRVNRQPTRVPSGAADSPPHRRVPLPAGGTTLNHRN